MAINTQIPKHYIAQTPVGQRPWSRATNVTSVIPAKADAKVKVITPEPEAPAKATPRIGRTHVIMPGGSKLSIQKRPGAKRRSRIRLTVIGRITPEDRTDLVCAGFREGRCPQGNRAFFRTAQLKAGKVIFPKAALIDACLPV